MKTITYTHLGLFGFAPVFIGDLDSDAPQLMSRWGLLGEMLFDLNQLLFWVFNLLLPPTMRGYTLTVTKALETPVIVELIDAAR